MIEGLKPYAKYKESGQQWLGKVPAHWDLKPGHAAFNKRKVSNVGLKENTVLSLSYGRIKVKAVDKQHGLVPASYETYQIVDEGNVIVRGTDLQNDKTSLRIGLSRNRGIISSAYLCLEARETISPDYGYHILNVFDLTKAIYRYGSGLRQNLDHGEIKRLPVFIPPPDEQASIVRFLDHANRKIDGFIRAKRKLIGLLNEQKQAIIHRAVTRGLDPTVLIKPSGIPWLGDIPAHWEVRKLKQCITRIKQGWSPQCDGQPSAANEWGVLKVGCVNKDAFNAEQNKKLPAKFSPDRDLEIRDGDVLMSRANTRELLGLAALAENPRSKLILCDKLFRFRPLLQCYIPKFLVLALRGKLTRAQIESSTNGASSSMQNIGQGAIKGLWVSMPPMNEQITIIAAVAEVIDPLTTAITRTEREIALMQEYRTRLTADIVTGKLDVREAAARLPDALPTPDANDAAPDHDEAESDDDEVAI